jgi:hypothetical protein
MIRQIVEHIYRVVSSWHGLCVVTDEWHDGLQCAQLGSVSVSPEADALFFPHSTECERVC